MKITSSGKSIRGICKHILLSFGFRINMKYFPSCKFKLYFIAEITYFITHVSISALLQITFRFTY